LIVEATLEEVGTDSADSFFILQLRHQDWDDIDTLHAEGLLSSIPDGELLSQDEHKGDGDQKDEMEQEEQEAAGGAVLLQIPWPIGPSSSEEEEVVVVVLLSGSNERARK
jgi:hypothetical protein